MKKPSARLAIEILKKLRTKDIEFAYINYDAPGLGHGEDERGKYISPSLNLSLEFIVKILDQQAEQIEKIEKIEKKLEAMTTEPKSKAEEYVSKKS